MDPQTTTERPALSRLFFALWPDDAVREALVDAVRPVRKTLQARWTKPEQYHITLVFLGDVPAERIPRLMELAEQVPFAPFEFALERVEFWPRPQVLCFTAPLVPEPLQRLVGALNDATGQIGLPVERRPFRVHMTFARKVVHWSQACPMEPLRWPVRDYCLVQSNINSEGSVYTVLRRWPAPLSPKPAV